MLWLPKAEPAKRRELFIVGIDDAGNRQYCLHEINPETFKPTALCGHRHESKYAAKHCPLATQMVGAKSAN